ncbi:MAG: ATP-binding protein [bacterium]|nr:ATP-binding protein [bacterium]
MSASQVPRPSKKYLAMSLDPYREMFEEMDDMILILDDSGMIEFANTALRRQLGKNRIRFTGRNLSERNYFDDLLSAEELLKTIFEEKSFITRSKTHAGENRHLDWKTKVFVIGKKKKAMAIIRDMTEHMDLQKKVEDYTKNLQEKVYERTHELEKEKQKAIELHQAKALFLSKMSHELRTPLTAIRGYAELLEEDEISDADRKQFVSVIEKNARGLLEMINETLNMIKIEQDRYQIHEKTFSLCNLIKHLMDTYQVLAREKGLQFHCQLGEHIPENIYSDPIAVSQILTNLIGNAIKFTHKGKVSLSVKIRRFPKKITQKLYFYVSDTGIGIPSHYHKRVFRSFEQYLDNQSVHERGSGLGLAISHQLAKLLNGEVKLLTSDTQKGSTFVFSLPVRIKSA